LIFLGLSTKIPYALENLLENSKRENTPVDVVLPINASISRTQGKADIRSILVFHILAGDIGTIYNIRMIWDEVSALKFRERYEIVHPKDIIVN
jgi:hypothetical protein